MPPTKRASRNPAQPDVRVSTEGEQPSRAASSAKKATANETAKQQLPRSKRSAPTKDENAEDRYSKEHRQAAVRLGSQLPRTRTAGPPTTQWDFDERQDTPGNKG
jgi:hypothetical protein